MTHTKSDGNSGAVHLKRISKNPMFKKSSSADKLPYPFSGASPGDRGLATGGLPMTSSSPPMGDLTGRSAATRGLVSSQRSLSGGILSPLAAGEGAGKMQPQEKC